VEIIDHHQVTSLIVEVLVEETSADPASILPFTTAGV